MDRREFLVAGAAALGAAGTGTASASPSNSAAAAGSDYRSQFPRLQQDVYINAARGTPLSTFSATGLDRYEEICRYGVGEGRGEPFFDMLDHIREDFGRLIGAKASEIALVQCTKAGEQIVLDGLPGLRAGGNVVTNDYHYNGSLHNLIGLKKAGLDVRIVRSSGWEVDLDAMRAAIDERTALVALTLVSNVNGRIEAAAELAEMAHAKGALVYADIIQAAGIVPMDVRELGIDFAACSGYKWLFGIHGAAFFYVRQELQGTALADRLFPGHARINYPPWAPQPAADADLYGYRAPTDARRYQPGHVNYLGFCALHEGLRFIHRLGVERLQQHSVALNQHLLAKIDADRYPCVSPHPQRSPIVTFLGRRNDQLAARLKQARVSVTLQGDRIRISPAIYNTLEDIDLLFDVLDMPDA